MSAEPEEQQSTIIEHIDSAVEMMRAQFAEFADKLRDEIEILSAKIAAEKQGEKHE